MDAIVIRNVSKQFRKSAVRREYTTLKSELVRWVTRKKLPLSMTHKSALNDINLTIKKGQTVGLVGRNGSGKSTLLKLVTGIYQPTSGSIEVHGRISALLELGAGFHPDFSGRENILINGIILGMTRREIRARVEEIIEFSELGAFADEPVRTYSSGMYARLAFSVATHVDPEILIVDEILSVGDAHFAHKSSAKMEEFTRQGKTILLVTHDLATLERRCDVAVWLDGGTVRASGNPKDVVAQYLQAVADGEALANGAPPAEVVAPSARQPRSLPAPAPGRRWGTFEMEISRVRVLDSHGATPQTFAADSPMTIAIDYNGAGAVENPYFEITISRDDDLLVWSGTTAGSESAEPLPLADEGTLSLALPRLGLGDGSYKVDVGAYAGDDRVCDFQRAQYAFTVNADSTETGVVRPIHTWSVSPAAAAVDEQVPPHAVERTMQGSGAKLRSP